MRKIGISHETFENKAHKRGNYTVPLLTTDFSQVFQNDQNSISDAVQNVTAVLQSLRVSTRH